MLNLPNPPQPISIPIRNAVTFEDRVALLLNKAGSSEDNPIVGSNYVLGTQTTGIAPSTTKGAALRVRVGVADNSETITSASVSTIDSNGNATSTKDIRSKFTKSSTQFQADLFVGSGEDIPSGSDSTRAFINISTNLGRTVKQQIYSRNVVDSAVLINGSMTSETVPAVYTKDTDASTTITVPVSFFSSWNDELGRQHGASSVALKNAIIKPYGGMKTVQVFLMSGTNRGTEVLAETDIKDVSSINISTSGATDDKKLGFFFRSKTGSDSTVCVFAYLKAITCAESSAGDNVPPDISGGTASFGTSGTIILDGAGNSGGTENTTVRLSFKGYKAILNHNLSGLNKDIKTSGSTTIDVDVTDFPYTFSTQSGQTGYLGNAAFADAKMILAEATNTAGTLLGNTLVFSKNPGTDHGNPAPPTIASSGYNFSTNVLTYNVSDSGNDSASNTTLYVKPLYSVIEESSPTAPETTIDDGIVTTTGVTEGSGTFSTGFSPTPDAVVLWAQSANTQWSNITGAYILDSNNHFFMNDPPSVEETFFTVPSISSVTSNSSGVYTITFSDRGGRDQNSTFVVVSRRYAVSLGSIGVLEETSGAINFPTSDTGLKSIPATTTAIAGAAQHVIEVQTPEGSTIFTFTQAS